MVTIGSVPTTNAFQINLCQLLFKATLKVSMFLTTLGMDNFDCTKMNAVFKKFKACLREGLIHEWKQALLAPYVTKQVTALFHTQRWTSNLSRYSLMAWCTYPMNETLVHQQLSLHQLHHCQPSQRLRKRYFRLRDVTRSIYYV